MRNDRKGVMLTRVCCLKQACSCAFKMSPAECKTGDARCFTRNSGQCCVVPHEHGKQGA